MNLVEQCILLLVVFANLSLEKEQNISISTFDFKEANDSLLKLMKEPYKFTKLIQKEIIKQFVDSGYVPTERQFRSLTEFSHDIRQLIMTVRKLLKDILPPSLNLIQVIKNALLNVIRTVSGSEAENKIQRITDFFLQLFNWKFI
ncbi:uncharacterized protein [Diabrotica undecimpunctata]|uniref:uncharacterized protein n=1 Tax=Diabrotica undecimpunctata TaxID=50387 RepID=UPI003B634906